MKKLLASSLIVAFMFSASVATPAPVHAAEMQKDTSVLQETLLGLLQQLVAAYTALLSQTEGTMMEGDSMMKDGVYTLTLDTNLEDLEKGHYEGWLIVGDEKISTGKFADGEELSFKFDTPIEDVDKVVVTIEPSGDLDDVPSGVVVLAGDVTNKTAELTFPVDLSDAAGSVILATPTNGSNSDETSGIWFLELPGPTVGLDLPELPNGWVYEGWAVYEGTPLTSGRFTEVDEADDFDGYSGPEAGPAFPGEDFLENAPDGVTFPIDLADGESAVVISVEPDIDGVDPTGDGPAQAKPLLVLIEEGQADHENIELDRDLGSLPSGSATLK